MAINEQIVTGRKFRKLVDETTKLWQRISFWTKASDVEFDDGTTAEEKITTINRLTDTLSKSVSNLNSHLVQQPEFIYDSNGKIIGYKTPGGADTVFPFKNSETVYKILDLKNEKNINNVIEITVDCTDLQGYDKYSTADFLVVPTSVCECNKGFEEIHMLDRVSWDYVDGILVIHNSAIGLGNTSDSQSMSMWYSSFDIYVR